jgi:hypothetical protein
MELAVLHGLATNSGWTALLPGFVLMGAGVGTTNPVLASTAIGVVPPRQAGMASGTNNTFRQVGIASESRHSAPCSNITSARRCM